MAAATQDTASRTRRLRFGLLFLLLEAALVLCWSSGFVGVRFATAHAPIFTILLWRSIAAGLLLLPFALLSGPAIRGRAVVEQSIIGALAMSGYLAGFALAIDKGVPTGLVALIADMVPLAVAILSLPVAGQAPGGRQWLGIVLGFLGVLVVSGDSVRLGSAPWGAYLLPMGGMLSLALATLVQKRFATLAMPLHQSLCIQCFSATAIFAVCAAFGGELVPPASAGFAIGIGWLVVLSTFGGYGIYFLCLRWSSPTRVSSVLYLSPPVTMLWAWAMFGEPLSWLMLAGLLVSLLGIVLAAGQVRRRSSRELAEHAAAKACPRANGNLPEISCTPSG